MLIHQLLTYYPKILKLRELNFSYAEIVGHLEKNHNIIINSKNKVNYLTAFISRVQANKINQSYKKYSLLFKPDNWREIILQNHVVPIGESLFFTFKSLVTPDYPEINQSNIHKIYSYKDAVLAKRIILWHEISDSELFELITSSTIYEDDEEGFPIFRCPQVEDHDFAKNIHLRIDEIINSAVTRLKQQLAESIE